jgi:hypothetical protein
MLLYINMKMASNWIKNMLRQPYIPQTFHLEFIVNVLNLMTLSPYELKYYNT